MKYSESILKLIKRLSICMVAYEFIVLITVCMRGWVILDLVALFANCIVYIIMKYTNVDIRIICILSSIVGLFSFFSLSGAFILIISALLIIYNIVILVKLSKESKKSNS